MQLDGFKVIAEYGSRFEADLVANRLTGDGVQTSVLSDPAHQIAPHIVTHRGHQLIVPEADFETASALLAPNDTDPAPAPAKPAAVGLSRRPPWFRWMALLLAGATFGPLAYGLVNLISRSF